MAVGNGGQEMNGWLSIDIELPTIQFPLLIWHDKGCLVGYYNVDKYTWFNLHDVKIDKVTHWQPLSFGPKGQGVVSSDMIKDE